MRISKEMAQSIKFLESQDVPIQHFFGEMLITLVRKVRAGKIDGIVPSHMQLFKRKTAKK